MSLAVALSNKHYPPEPLLLKHFKQNIQYLHEVLQLYSPELLHRALSYRSDTHLLNSSTRQQLLDHCATSVLDYFFTPPGHVVLLKKGIEYSLAKYYSSILGSVLYPYDIRNQLLESSGAKAYLESRLFDAGIGKANLSDFSYDKEAYVPRYNGKKVYYLLHAPEDKILSELMRKYLLKKPEF